MSRIVVVVKRTAYEAQRNDPRVVSLLRRNDPTVRRLRGSHEEHEATVAAVRQAIERLGVEASFVEGAETWFATKGVSLVVTVGGDGTLLSASHNVSSTPILGVNSAPSYSVGFFCAAKKDDFERLLRRALSGRIRRVTLTRMEVRLNRKIIARRVLNEALFCHATPAATSRYILELDGRVEEHKSSGFWIGPAAGSTAAQHSAGGRILPLTSRSLQLVVREPYTPAGERLRLTRALVRDGSQLIVRSKMDDARIFLDGPHHVFNVRIGDEIVFRRSPESLTLLGLGPKRRWLGENNG